MNSVFPVVLLLALLWFPATFSQPAEAEIIVADTSIPNIQVEGMEIDRKGDYDSIYSYIRTKYKKISDEDAKQIAQSLVDSGVMFSIDPKFVAALIERESGFRKDAVSVTGARGLGQIKDFNFKSLNIDNPEDIQQNVNGTASYIKSLLNRWGDRTGKVSLALASYFRGYSAIKSQGGFDPKTREYVGDIIQNYSYITAYKTSMPVSDPASQTN